MIKCYLRQSELLPDPGKETVLPHVAVINKTGLNILDG
jgi:hypothetical protein